MTLFDSVLFILSVDFSLSNSPDGWRCAPLGSPPARSESVQTDLESNSEFEGDKTAVALS